MRKPSRDTDTATMVGRMSDAQRTAAWGRRSSSASGAHDSRPKRDRTRLAAKSRAINESRSS
jgi:hypothetical protein